jgi:tRNA pseudouridine38-40 synthase
MRIAAGVEYDGAGYCGWQIQKDVPTVQESVQRALSKVADQPVHVACAGRTDTGVHAVGQVIHFETTVSRSQRSWVLGANANLPADICLLWTRPVPGVFHARFSARSRRYRYVLLNRWVRPATLKGKVTWEPRPLDEARMRAAAAALRGEHDFSSFRALACQAKSPIRTIYELSVTRERDLVYIDVHANAFLHHMVRNIAGVLLAIGAGERAVSWVEELLALRDRARGGVTAPAHGLYLVGVRYESDYGLTEPSVWPRFG